MKRTITTCLFCSLLALAACKKELSPEAAAANCKLTEITSTASNDIGAADPYTVTSTEKITYNDQNLQSGYSFQALGKYSSNKTYTYNASYNYQYDGNGYVQKTIYQSAGKDKDGKTNTSNYTEEYTYTNNRLSKNIQTYSGYSNGKTSTGSRTIVYEYSSEGNLTKYTYSYSNSGGSSGTSFTTYEYSSGKLSKLSYSDGRGGIIIPIIEVNGRGLVTKNVTTSREFRYQYDAGGNLLRTEEYNSGKKTDIRLSETDGKQNAYNMVYPVFKGHPDLDFYMGKSSQYSFTGNITKDERLIVDAAGNEKPSSSVAYTYSYNGHNLPATSTRTAKDYTGKITQQSSSGFTYKDCQ